MNDAGKVGTYSFPVTQTEGPGSSATTVAWEATAEPLSKQIVVQELRCFCRDCVKDGFAGSFSQLHGGSNVPYADQHAPQVGPQTPGPKKGL